MLSNGNVPLNLEAIRVQFFSLVQQCQSDAVIFTAMTCVNTGNTSRSWYLCCMTTATAQANPNLAFIKFTLAKLD
jgi:hypothetical protein